MNQLVKLYYDLLSKYQLYLPNKEQLQQELERLIN